MVKSSNDIDIQANICAALRFCPLIWCNQTAQHVLCVLINVLIYFCILSKVKLHTKHISFCTILVLYILFQEYVFKYMWIFFFFLWEHRCPWIIFSSFHPPGGLTVSLKRTWVFPRIRPHTGHSIHFILYMTMKQKGFDGCDSKIVQNGTLSPRLINGFYQVCVVRWDVITAFM